jgi:hypothetical protein
VCTVELSLLFLPFNGKEKDGKKNVDPPKSQPEPSLL